MNKSQLNEYGNQPVTSCVGYGNMGDSFHQLGITLKEHFAGLAMQGLVNNNFCPTGFQNGDENSLAELAVKCADALLEALAKKEKDLK